MTYDEMLSKTPTNPAHAQNYAELFSLWKDQPTKYYREEGASDCFDEWDNSVQRLLTPNELAFYMTPYADLDMNRLEFRKVSRQSHLTKILVHRQGIKTTNGFNG
jgi:hypothetical protein